LILAQREEGFEEIVADGKPEQQFLPREERAVEEPSEALRMVSRQLLNGLVSGRELLT